MKKFFVSFVLFAALIFVISCGGGSKTGDNTDTGEVVTDEDTVDTDSPSDTDSESDTEPTENPDSDDPATDPTTDPTNDPTTDPTEPTSDPTTDPTEQMAEGIYLGIIGFNYQLNIRNLSYLTNANMTEFQDFIDDFEMDDGTALYFADYTALKMMRDYTPVPPKLQTVALVTFTDGEDTSSDGPTNDPENYNDPDVYLNAIHNKIVTNGIHGLSVEAYSIGLRSGDTGSDFKSKLEKLASSSNNAFEVSNMDEVQERFTKIAEDLYSVFKTINIDFKVLGNYSDGTRMRFSLDISCDHDENVCEKNGVNSNLYIDATYHRNGSERSFDNFAYHGFSGSLTTVKCGERDAKGFYPCSFENLQYDNMDTEIKQIELWKNDNNEWKHENEALKQEDSNVNESKSSALIMLVLDCTTSLGNSKFKKLQEAGKDFIETLVNGGSGVTTTSCDNDPCASVANSTGVCVPSGTGYICGCSGDYEWNGSQCVKPATPCDPNPCTGISNSNGNCTVSGSSYVCGCNSGYNWSGTQCLDTAAEECATLGGTWNSSTGKCTRTANCSSKPANTAWNTVSSITQTYNYDDEVWEPSTTSSYNTSGSTQYCRYKCATGYDWNGSTCVDPAAEECTTLGGTWNSSTSKCTRTANCSSKPTNTVWNTVSSITQTYNYDNEAWEPATTSSYNTSGSTSQCRYKCASGYEWNGSTCQIIVLSLGEICTNQKTCYNASSSMTCPSSSSADFYGQDAQYTSKCTAQSFTVQTISSQKVVLDNNTGLMWQQTPPSTTYTWTNAKNYCSNLEYAGYSDWRLPNPQELLTIVDNSKYGPAINTTYFPNMSSTSDSVYYWSSKPYGTDKVQLLRLYYGTIYYYSYTQSSSLNVVCVRGSELPKASFTTQTISGEVVVKDSTTGLMWQKTYPTGTKSWQSALKYCESLVYAGYDDWRLPNKNELASLVNYDKSAAPYSDFPDMPSEYFWSSSTHVGNTSYAWYVSFNYGNVSYNGKTNGSSVRCVR
ncbi:DUF1566 domain-containing protein [bacterium]|nr:DUF1566 domain-containing protein [bacterium]